MSETTALPRWDLSPVFPALDSPEFAGAFDSLMDGLADLAALFDARGIRRRPEPAVDAAFAATYDEVVGRFNALLDGLRTVGAYIGCLTSTDARDEAAQARESLLQARGVLLDQLQTRFAAWVGSSDVDALLSLSQTARDHEHAVRRAAVLARRQMSEPEETLAAELRPMGLGGWARLHGNLTALLTATVHVRGEDRVLPMSAVRALGSDPDRAVRRAAYEAEQEAWEGASVSLAAALNGIKGFQGTVRRKRGWADDVEPTLLANSIDRQTLEAMQAACVESFPDFRRYLAAKARLLGLPRLAWYDLLAPVGSASRQWPWPEAEEFVRSNFRRYSDRMADFADAAFRERWIDAEPRVAKEGGAYCTGILPGVSRIMMNFDGSFSSVSTLAHELGHAYHNLNLGDRTPLQRMTPSTLAETASIFCETLAFDAALANATEAERITLLETTLEGACQVVVDIHSRFLFEKSVFERRAVRDLTVAELCGLMLEGQRQTYGDAVDPLHPWMWAVKGHYYGPTFYNYPYTFGLLFGLAVYAEYRKDPERVRAMYDDFLSSTGMADARTLGRRFGVDVTDVAFWRSSLDVLRGQIAEYERLAG